ncbi:unnamed protein product [Caenorhabditis auriculariae]|uniref:Conserved oligomeric Golgi complex subunit 8 n=1 Tax=Caenorhabditis auriculariae TaxID=2777116 RepID=A0A8S1HW10_9PELO|nr:unnamed protein product [Caenorhabditis auriculariae]
MEEREAQLQIEDEVRSMGIEQMRREKALLASELKSIEAQISDLAFNNYGTYADAGRATHDCSKVFHEMRDKTDGLSAEISHMNEEFQSFRAKSKALSAEQELIRKAIDKSNPVWELLSLPSRMDICIRAGYYDSAYSLTNYGMQLQQQSALIKEPIN